MENDEKLDKVPEDGLTDAGNIELAKSLQAVLEGISSLNDKLDKCMATGKMETSDASEDEEDPTDDIKQDDMSEEELAKGLGL